VISFLFLENDMDSLLRHDDEALLGFKIYMKRGRASTGGGCFCSKIPAEILSIQKELCVCLCES